MSEKITREQLVELLNEDLAREYQAIIAYVIYSQTMKGAAYTAIADEWEVHARGVTLTTEAGWVIEAKKVVFATGYLTPQFLDQKRMKNSPTPKSATP